MATHCRGQETAHQGDRETETETGTSTQKRTSSLRDVETSRRRDSTDKSRWRLSGVAGGQLLISSSAEAMHAQKIYLYLYL